ncbi:hypothetical protein JI435_411880 [Parastagonospora nodorum SN15]|uniref:Uncharacterized protein n=1 Tax=Phaeosphaeria nodorum (strain SN15 / ATCC MYA-4574 / FGSC 10173) TaxID=321614 RepID=A0A7U2I046_PHANO|nr:hypothetical protein HBH53_216480 [Parastagonospora nodorum]QRC98325.1 hypothetical protein JI435_411880 [Parastagonospora nodorum SN15]KAH3998404.1 hypothetical protein HBI10_129790 [Parastagonospora nodorum]KAH4030172.1 hypothetical protein HBI13_037790 [Parastagonospora nodorum]KAH4236827.1 hypothetical protein HBI06_052470 [Parastagonospora nodorum]
MSVEFIVHKGLKQEVPENKYGRFIIMHVNEVEGVTYLETAVATEELLLSEQDRSAYASAAN